MVSETVFGDGDYRVKRDGAAIRVASRLHHTAIGTTVAPAAQAHFCETTPVAQGQPRLKLAKVVDKLYTVRYVLHVYKFGKYLKYRYIYITYHIVLCNWHCLASQL